MKDINPTPSQPRNKRKRFPAETRSTMAKRKMRRYLKNTLILGSICIYQIEYSRMLHVTKKATGRKIIVYASYCREKGRSRIARLNHLALITVDEVP